MLGSFAVALALAASLGGIFLYSLSAAGKKQFHKAARIVTYIAIGGILSAAATLLYLIFTYQFQYTYVLEHVSRSLSKPLLFSTFYASQEGSFMLWAVLTSIVALILIPYSARQRYEAHVMPVYLAVLAFLALMLVVKSPFDTIYATHPGQATAGFIPADGKGLNPQLENLWIVIHPPMLFMGFTLLAVPFAFAIAALMRRDYQGWVTTSLPWTLGSGMVLGFGIMLGGFWAYETLGWGGYWAWDPVENSSLLPWLIIIASGHTMLTQKKTGGLIKTNIAMTILAFSLVLYSSFLTRSGILGDFSVHSFADPGALAFRLLLYVLIVFLAFSAFMFFRRWKDMTVLGDEYKIMSRESALAIGSAILGASALVVFVGTSAPLVKKSVDSTFYDNLHIPIAIVLMLVNGLSLLLKWKQSSAAELLKKGAIAFGLAAIATGLVVWSHVREAGYIAIVFTAFFALFVNLEIAYKILRGRFRITFDRSGVRREDYWRRIRMAMLGTLAVAVVALLVTTAGDYNLFVPAIARGWLWFSVVALLLAALFVGVGYPRVDADTRFLGAYISHAGLALFVLGVVASAHYSEVRNYELPENEPVKAFDGQYTLTFRGIEYQPPKTVGNENYYWRVEVQDESGKTRLARPLWFYTQYNGGKEPILNPGILKYGTRDVYFTSRGKQIIGGVPKDSLKKGAAMQIFDSLYTLQFVEFDFPPSERQKMMANEDFHVKAKLALMTSASVDTVTIGVTRNLQTQEVRAEDYVIPGTHYHLQLSELRPDLQDRNNSKIVFRHFDDTKPIPPEKDVMVVEAFIKPYINLVWLGVIVLVSGFGFAVRRRKREAALMLAKAEAAYQKLSEKRVPSDPVKGPVPGHHEHQIQPRIKA